MSKKQRTYSFHRHTIHGVYRKKRTDLKLLYNNILERTLTCVKKKNCANCQESIAGTDATVKMEIQNQFVRRVLNI